MLVNHLENIRQWEGLSHIYYGKYIIQMFQTTNQITILVGSTLGDSTILIGKTW
jgi:hypothetical protein